MAIGGKGEGKGGWMDKTKDAKNVAALRCGEEGEKERDMTSPLNLLFYPDCLFLLLCTP